MSSATTVACNPGVLFALGEAASAARLARDGLDRMADALLDADRHADHGLAVGIGQGDIGDIKRILGDWMSEIADAAEPGLRIRPPDASPSA